MSGQYGTGEPRAGEMGSCLWGCSVLCVVQSCQSGLLRAPVLGLLRRVQSPDELPSMDRNLDRNLAVVALSLCTFLNRHWWKG